MTVRLLAAENVLNLPTDYYLNYTARETLKYLRPKLGAGSSGAMWLDSLQKIDDEAAAKQAAADKPVEKKCFEISTLPAKNVI